MISKVPLVFLISSLLSLIGDSGASSSSSNPSHQPDITAFTFSRSTESAPQIDMLSYEASNNEKCASSPYTTTASSDNISDNSSDSNNDEDSSTVASSLLYDGGCVVSAEAIMCTGGDDQAARDYYNSRHTSTTTTSSSSSFSFDQYDLDYYDDEESDDDDDDDDNDGHSSMLSNASLRRRTKVSATGSSSSYNNRQHEQREYSGGNDASSTTAFFRKNNNNKASPLSTRCSILSPSATTISNSNNKALFIRGGAGVSDLGTEFAKKLIVTALVTLVYEGMIGHMLEFIKICMQTADDGTSYATVLQSITAEKGLLGLWDGFIPWGVIQAIFKGSVFGLAHAVASSLLVPLADQGRIPMPLALTLAGGIGGGFQGFVLSPTLLLKTRVMTSEVFREKMSVANTTYLSAKIGLDVVAKEGVGALMKGADVFATKRVFDWASRYFFSDLFETLAVNYKGGAALTVTERIGCSLLGGTVSTYVTLPLDALVAKIQDAKKAGVKVSAWRMFQNELSEKGWNGLTKSYMKGFEIRLLHVALTTVAIKTGTPIAYDLIFPPQVAAHV